MGARQALLGLAAVALLAGAASAAGPPIPAVRLDVYGDPLPPGAVARIGTLRLQMEGRVAALAFSPDGRQVLSAEAGALVGWDCATGREVWRATPAVRSPMCFSADGRVLAGQHGPAPRPRLAWHRDGLPPRRVIGLWDTSYGLLFRRPEYRGGEVRLLAISPEGRRVASVDSGGTLRVWDGRGGKEGLSVRLPRGPSAESAADGLLLGPGGNRIVVGLPAHGSEARHTVRLLDGDSGRVLGTLDDAGGGAMALSPCGTLLALADLRGAVRLWDLPHRRGVRTLRGHEGSVTALAFSPDGRVLASAGEDRTVRLWDARTGRERARVVGHRETITCVAFAPDGRTLASGGWDRVVRLWEVATGGERLRFGGGRREVVSAAFAPNGRVLAAGMGDRVRLWDTTSWEVRKELPAPPGRLGGPVFSPDGRALAWAGEDGLVLQDPATGRVVRELTDEQVKGPVVFSPDGRQVAAKDRAETVVVWEARTGRRVGEVEAVGVWGGPLAFSPDGKLLAGTDRGLALTWWDVATGEVRRPPPDCRVTPRAVRFSADGRRLAALCYGGVVLTWRLDTGKRVGRVKLPRPPGDDWRLPATFSPDGRFLAFAAGGPSPGEPGTVADLSQHAAEAPPTVWVYDAGTGKQLRRFRGRRAPVRTLAFSGDGGLLVSVDWDGKALVWSVDGRSSAPRHAAPDRPDIGELWADLAGADAERAYRAVLAIADHPCWWLPLLRERLRPARAPGAGKLRRLVRDLGSEDFAERRRAERELEGLGELAVPALRRLLASKPPLETHVRAERLIVRAGARPLTGGRLRQVRAVEAVERVGNEEARRLLRGWAGGAEGATLTEEARAALRRLQARATALRSPERRP